MLTECRHQEMQRMSIETLYQFKLNCERENTKASLRIAFWCQYYIDCKFGGLFL